MKYRDWMRSNKRYSAATFLSTEYTIDEQEMFSVAQLLFGCWAMRVYEAEWIENHRC